jgi:hypothetical protein
LLHQNAAAFFGKQRLPQSQVNSEILNIQNASDMKVPRNQEIITLLDQAMLPTSCQEQSAVVNDFTVRLFHMLHYTWGHRVARTHMHIQLFVCGKFTHDYIDVCLLDGQKNDLMLIVQDDKCFVDGELDVEAQLIAKAVAVFRLKNRLRWETNRPLLKSQVWPSLGLMISY